MITGDLPNATYRGQTVDDLLINASSITIDGVNGILGQAGPDAFRSGSDLPYHGIMQFDSADMASMESSGLLYSVVLHEMGHILGIGTLWEDLGLLSGAGTSNPIFTGANATAAVQPDLRHVGPRRAGREHRRLGNARFALARNRSHQRADDRLGRTRNKPAALQNHRRLARRYRLHGELRGGRRVHAIVLRLSRRPFGASSSLAASRSFGILAAENGVSSSTTTTRTQPRTQIPTNLQSRRSTLPVSHITPIDQDIADYVLAASARASASNQIASDSTTGSTTSDDTSTDTCATDQAWESLAADWNLLPAAAVA